MPEPTTREILEAINVFAESVDKRFDAVDKRFDVVEFGIKTQFKEVNQRLDQTNERIDKLYTLVDGFIQLHQKLDLELTALRSMYQRLEERIQKLEVQRA